MYQHQLSLSLSLHDGTCLSLSLSFFPNGYRFEKPSTRVYHVSTEWSHEELTRISLFPTGLSHIREHARAENSGSKAGGGGWPCVGSRTAIPDMAISHNERQWCPRLETQRGRQLINSPSLVCYAEFSRPAPPRFGSVIAITRTII